MIRTTDYIFLCKIDGKYKEIKFECLMGSKSKVYTHNTYSTS